MRWGLLGRLVPLAAATCIAFGVPALAEDAAPSTGHGTASVAAGPKFEVSIPAMQAENSSIDETTLRAIFTGDIASHADELANLKASSIRVPEIRLTYSAPEIKGVAETGSILLRDVRLQKVANGVAQAIIIGSYETTSGQGGDAKLGKVSAEDFDIGGLLAFIGLVKGDPNGPRKTLYRDFRVAGGTIVSKEANCTLAPSNVMRVSVRPLKVSFVDLFNMAKNIDASDGGKPTKEQLGMIVNFFVDLIDAIEISPMKIGGFSCSGTDDDGTPISVKLGQTTVGAFARERYPDFVARDVAISSPGDGEISLGEFDFKGLDLSGPLAALRAAAGDIDEKWFEDNYRALVPAFDGFAFSKFAMDIPDPDSPHDRFKASIAKFDLTLKNWINAIPSDISTSASHIVAAVPDNTSDEQLRALLAYGIDKFDIGFDFGVKWDEKSNEVRFDPFSINGVDMGSIVASSAIGNATRDLFSSDPIVVLATAMGLTLKHVDIDIKDAGLADVILRAAAKEADKDVAALRSGVAAMTKGTIVLFLGSAANAEKVSTAVSDFINGKRSLSVSVTSKDPAGVSFDALRAAEEDPTTLLDKIDIDASAK